MTKSSYFVGRNEYATAIPVAYMNFTLFLFVTGNIALKRFKQNLEIVVCYTS